MPSRTFYSLRHRKTGQLLRLRTSANGDAGDCNDTSVYLTATDVDEYPIFEVASLDSLRGIMAVDTPWFNSDVRSPCWDGIDVPNDCEPVQVVKTIDVLQVPLAPAVNLSTWKDPKGKVDSIFAVDITKPLVRTLLGEEEFAARVELIQGRRSYGGFVAPTRMVPEGLDDQGGEPLYFGSTLTERYLIGVRPTPENERWKAHPPSEWSVVIYGVGDYMPRG